MAASHTAVEKAARGGWVRSYTYDLSSMQSVRDFASAVREDVPAINVLLNNAGVQAVSTVHSNIAHKHACHVSVLL